MHREREEGKGKGGMSRENKESGNGERVEGRGERGEGRGE